MKIIIKNKICCIKYKNLFFYPFVGCWSWLTHKPMHTCRPFSVGLVTQLAFNSLAHAIIFKVFLSNYNQRINIPFLTHAISCFSYRECNLLYFFIKYLV